MNKEKVFSFTKGYTFSFVEGKDIIQAWFSSLSGLEKVYVNGELVSYQRNLSTDSTNNFSIGANDYSTNLSVTSLFKGPFVCTLSKNGKEYKRQRLVFPKVESSSKKLSFIVRFLFFIVLGALFGFARLHWQLPKESIYVFIALLFIIALTYQLRNHKGSEPIIEHEHIV